MQMVIAIIQPEKLEDVKEALFHADVNKMTVSRVKGCGRQGGYSESYRGQVKKVNLLDKIQIEVAVNDAFVEPTVAAIIKGARTCSIGDGKIFVMPMTECVRIRTDERGEDAIG